MTQLSQVGLGGGRIESKDVKGGGSIVLRAGIGVPSISSREMQGLRVIRREIKYLLGLRLRGVVQSGGAWAMEEHWR